MQYSDHPEYLNHCDNIIKLLDEGYETKISSTNNSFIDQPEALETQYYSAKHHKLKQYLHTNLGTLEILGFKKNDVLSENKIFFICRCVCGNYTYTNEKTITSPKPSSYACCSDCKNEVYSFGEAYGILTGQRLTYEVLLSIFNLYPGQPFEKFVHGPYKPELSLENNPLLKLTYNQLANILDSNPKLDNNYWSIIGNTVYYKRTNKPIECVYLSQPQIINKELTEKSHPEVFNYLGKKIFRLKIIGILKHPDHSTKSTLLVGLCDCGLYGTTSLNKLNPDKLPTCNRCEQILNITITKSLTEDHIELTRQEAWMKLGQNVEVVPDQIKTIKPKQNAIIEPYIKPLEFKKVRPEHRDIIGSKIGLVTPISLSNTYSSISKSPYFICKCECGNECKLSWDKIKPQNTPKFFACPICCTEIQRTFKSSIHPTDGANEGKFYSDWNKYIKYLNCKKATFSRVFRKYLKYKKTKPNLKFKTVVRSILLNHQES